MRTTAPFMIYVRNRPGYTVEALESWYAQYLELFATDVYIKPVVII
jgi:hypothetical protein